MSRKKDTSCAARPGSEVESDARMLLMMMGFPDKALNTRRRRNDDAPRIETIRRLYICSEVPKRGGPWGGGRMAAAPGAKFNYSSGVSVKNMMCALGVKSKSAKRVHEECP